jgi:hypothetical protein
MHEAFNQKGPTEVINTDRHDRVKLAKELAK